jgi:aspartyl-tRNA(Asn)/glutamyl-tRNA(Gln) amidotransferase subunit B
MAVSDAIKQEYEATIGIETHVQLNTKTKLFSAVGNDSRTAAPNTLISHIDTGMPGALPVLNKAAIDLAAKVAFALNTVPQKFSKFDRKHYFYPDLPKGYQITQYEHPFIIGGYVDINPEGKEKRIAVTRVHLEEDAGKNIHPPGADYSLVDLNRAGTPLLEIVSEPLINSASEAKAYARELYLLIKYSEVSDVDLYQGNMRFDVNVSVSKSPGKLGVRIEVKNLNSFRSVENAVNYEIARQIEAIEKGQSIIQETRGWDEAKQKTISQRGKEEANDYRYMPEPDIPPVVLDDEWIRMAKNTLPQLPSEIRTTLSDHGIESNIIEDILENQEVYKRVNVAIEKNTKNEEIRRIAFDSLEMPKINSITIEDHIKLAQMITLGQLSSTAGKEILQAKIDNPSVSIEELAKDKEQLSDLSQIEFIVSEILEQNPQAVSDVRSGEIKAIGFLIGQVMAKSKGKANPQIAQETIKKQLGL